MKLMVFQVFASKISFSEVNNFIERQDLANIDEFSGKKRQMILKDKNIVLIADEALIAGWGMEEALKEAMLMKMQVQMLF